MADREPTTLIYLPTANRGDGWWYGLPLVGFPFKIGSWSKLDVAKVAERFASRVEGKEAVAWARANTPEEFRAHATAEQVEAWVIAVGTAAASVKLVSEGKGASSAHTVVNHGYANDGSHVEELIYWPDGRIERQHGLAKTYPSPHSSDRPPVLYCQDAQCFACNKCLQQGAHARALRLGEDHRNRWGGLAELLG